MERRQLFAGVREIVGSGGHGRGRSRWVGAASRSPRSDTAGAGGVVTSAQRSNADVAFVLSVGANLSMLAPWLPPATSNHSESRVPGPSRNGSAPHGSFWPYTNSIRLAWNFTHRSMSGIAR